MLANPYLRRHRRPFVRANAHDLDGLGDNNPSPGRPRVSILPDCRDDMRHKRVRTYGEERQLALFEQVPFRGLEGMFWRLATGMPLGDVKTGKRGRLCNACSTLDSMCGGMMARICFMTVSPRAARTSVSHY